MSTLAPAGLRLTDGMALNCGDPSSCVTLFHSASAIFASASVVFTVASYIPLIRGSIPVPGGTLTLISSHIHCPTVEKLKYLPRMAYPFKNDTLLPVGWPLAVQFPVSSNQVRNRPSCTTSPPTPSISTQSLTLTPFGPIRTNQPQNARMKS